jgi:DNA polymerase III alpha subunit
MEITNDIIEMTLDKIANRYGIRPDLDLIKLDDDKTRHILKQGLYFCVTDFDRNYLPNSILTNRELYGKYISTLTYKSAYLKAHYPVEFMTTAISNLEIFEGVLELFFDECKKLDIAILKPSILKSNISFEPLDDNVILYGFIGLQIAPYKMEGILSEREKANFGTFEEFLQRLQLTSLDSEDISVLIKSGALDDFGYSRKAMLRNTQLQENVYTFSDEHKKLSEYDASSLIAMELQATKTSFTKELGMAMEDEEDMIQKIAQENGIHLSRGAILELKRHMPTSQYELEFDMLRLDAYASLADLKINSTMIENYYSKGNE